MTTSALTGGFAVCQTRLGAKVHDPKDPGADLGPMFRQVVGTILRLAGQHADHWLRDPGQPRRPGLRLRADHRPAAARGEHAPAAVGVPPGLADARRHVARDVRAGQRRDASWSWPRRPASSPTRPGRELGIGGDGIVGSRDDRRDGRRARRVPLPRRPLGAAHLRPGHRGPRRPSRRRGARRGARARLLRARRQLRHREPRTSRPTRRRSASSARPASSSSSSRTSSSAGRQRQPGRRVSGRPPLPGADPHPGRQPARPPRSWSGSAPTCSTSGPAS